MGNDIAVIQNNPHRVPVFLPMPRGKLFPRQFLLNAICDGLNLAMRRTARDYKKIGEIGRVLHVQDHHFVCLFGETCLCNKKCFLVRTNCSTRFLFSCSKYAIKARAAIWTFSLHSGPSVFHGYPLGFFHLLFGLALHTICIHSTPPLMRT